MTMDGGQSAFETEVGTNRLANHLPPPFTPVLVFPQRVLVQQFVIRYHPSGSMQAAKLMVCFADSTINTAPSSTLTSHTVLTGNRGCYRL